MQKLVQDRTMRMCIPDRAGQHEPHFRRWGCWFRGHLRVIQVWEGGVLVETSIYY